MRSFLKILLIFILISSPVFLQEDNQIEKKKEELVSIREEISKLEEELSKKSEREKLIKRVGQNRPAKHSFNNVLQPVSPSLSCR